MKKILWHAFLLSMAGAVLGWVLWPSELRVLFTYYDLVAEDCLFTDTDIRTKYDMRIQNSLSWALLPWFAFATLAALVRFRHMEWATRRFYRLFGFAIIGYVSAAGLKAYQLGNIMDYKLTPLIKNPLSLRALGLYDWGLYGAAMVCVLLFLFTKKRKAA